MSNTEFKIFGNDDAIKMLAELHDGPPNTVGDAISAAILAVAHREGYLQIDLTNRALAALALLFSEIDPGLLDSADDRNLENWFADLDVQLNPARKLIAEAALGRIALPQQNEWYERWRSAGRLDRALEAVHWMRDLLADSDWPNWGEVDEPDG